MLKSTAAPAPAAAVQTPDIAVVERARRATPATSDARAAQQPAPGDNHEPDADWLAVLAAELEICALS